MLCIWLSIFSVDRPFRAKQLIYNTCCALYIVTWIKFHLWFRICFRFLYNLRQCMAKNWLVFGKYKYFQKISESAIFSDTCIWFSLENPEGEKKNYKIPIETWTRVQLWTWTFIRFLWNLCQCNFHIHFSSIAAPFKTLQEPIDFVEEKYCYFQNVFTSIIFRYTLTGKNSRQNH